MSFFSILFPTPSLLWRSFLLSSEIRQTGRLRLFQMPPRQKFLPREDEMLFYFIFCTNREILRETPGQLYFWSCNYSHHRHHSPSYPSCSDLGTKTKIWKTMWRLWTIWNISQKIFDCCPSDVWELWRLDWVVVLGLAWPGNTGPQSGPALLPASSLNLNLQTASLPSTPTNHNIHLVIFKIKLVINNNNLIMY